ncbi:MAG: flagellar protein FlaG [Calditrichaeota bacterium]|nr:flagellar protein FlaG [Calditrichota bacterium]
MEIESIKMRVAQPQSVFQHAGRTVQQSKAKEIPRPNQQTRKVNADLRQLKIEKAVVNDPNSLREIARKVREHLKQAGIKIQFEIKEDAGKIVIIVKDPVTDKVVREIPPDVYLKMVEHIKQLQEPKEFQGWEIDSRQ